MDFTYKIFFVVILFKKVQKGKKLHFEKKVPFEIFWSVGFFANVLPKAERLCRSPRIFVSSHRFSMVRMYWKKKIKNIFFQSI
jgi:hypothetical protein